MAVLQSGTRGLSDDLAHVACPGGRSGMPGLGAVLVWWEDGDGILCETGARLPAGYVAKGTTPGVLGGMYPDCGWLRFGVVMPVGNESRGPKHAVFALGTPGTAVLTPIALALLVAFMLSRLCGLSTAPKVVWRFAYEASRGSLTDRHDT